MSRKIERINSQLTSDIGGKMLPQRMPAMVGVAGHTLMNTFVIPRSAIESNDVASIVTRLELMTSSAPGAFFRQLNWSISGYEDDARELFQIPGVVQFLRELDEQWPNWAFYQHPRGRWARTMTLCLAETQFTGESRIAWDQSSVVDLYLRWSEALNRLAIRADLPYSSVVVADGALCRLMDLGRQLPHGEAV